MTRDAWLQLYELAQRYAPDVLLDLDAMSSDDALGLLRRLRALAAECRAT